MCDMVIGKWKKIMPYRFNTSSGKEVSIWTDVQAKFPKLHLSLECIAQTLMINKAAGFDAFGLEVIRAVLQHHP